MADNNNKMDILDFGDGDVADSIIKVIGVGGGGGNAVNHMYREGIHDVTSYSVTRMHKHLTTLLFLFICNWVKKD